MNLGKLAFACYIFEQRYGGGYADFYNEFSHLNLFRIDGWERFLELLNSYWKCRVSGAIHQQSAQQLHRWYQDWSEQFPEDRQLQELQDQENDLDLAASAYNQLLKYKDIGDTTASKILFCLRPKALPLWDNKIKKSLKDNNKVEGTGGNLYKSYIQHVGSVIDNLSGQCRQHNINLGELPTTLHPNSNCSGYITLPKLIDEYYWITITREITPPPVGCLERWVEWSIEH